MRAILGNASGTVAVGLGTGLGFASGPGLGDNPNHNATLATDDSRAPSTAEGSQTRSSPTGVCARVRQRSVLLLSTHGEARKEECGEGEEREGRGEGW